MKYVINILIETESFPSVSWRHTELYPIAFKTTEEAEHELKCEGYGRKTSTTPFSWEWVEENIRKTATLKYTNIGWGWQHAY